MPCLEINFDPKKIGSDRSVKISKEASDQGASSGLKPVLIQKRNQGFIRIKICFKKYDFYHFFSNYSRKTTYFCQAFVKMRKNL